MDDQPTPSLVLRVPFLYRPAPIKPIWERYTDVSLASCSRLTLQPALREGEHCITGSVLFSRVWSMARDGRVPAGQRHISTLMLDEARIPATWQPFTLLFPGTIFRGGYGDLRIAYLAWMKRHGWVMSFECISRMVGRLLHDEKFALPEDRIVYAEPFSPF